MKKILENKTESFKYAQEFDIKFWKKVKAAVKFSAMWKMIREFYRIKGKHGYKLRLQRSVQTIKQA